VVAPTVNEVEPHAGDTKEAMETIGYNKEGKEADTGKIIK
jgi:hypothetical protein